MANIKIPFRAGNTAQNNAYTGVPSEITVDSQARTLRVHDGLVAGGEPLLRQSDLAVVNALKAQVDASLTAGAVSTAQAAAAAALASQTSATASQASATASATTSSTALAGTTSAAAQAATARDQANAALAVALAPNESLPTISKSIHSGAIVSIKGYFTSKDSDGGAWRKRCTDKSWYTEALGGTTWIGQATNELTARGDNLLSYPEQFDNAYWSKLFATITANTIVAPDGASVADKIVEDTTLNAHRIISTAFAVATGTVYAVTLWLKQAGRGFAYIRVTDTVGDTIAGTINLTTGAVSQTQWGVITSEIRADGWVKVTATGICTGANTTFEVRCANAATYATYTGDGTSGIYIWGAKLNQVGTLPSTYSGSPELVTNGGFDNGTVGWTTASIAASTATNTAGELQVTATVGYGRQITAVACIVGKTYSFSGSARLISGSSRATIGITASSAGAAAINIVSSTSATASSGTGSFIATATTMYIILGDDLNISGGVMGFDNISVKEVTILATPYVPYSTLATSFYQNTTDGKYYALNATYGQTEVFRGNVREFPEQVAIVAEAARVVIYDLTQVGCPMWMVLLCTGSTAWWGSGSVVTSVAILNGVLSAGTSGGGMRNAHLVSDRYGAYATTGAGTLPSLSVRNSLVGPYVAPTGAGIANNVINDIAITVLEGAPVDPATGLQIPTIAVATAGGVSVIKHDGTVANSLTTNAITSICVLALDTLYYGTSVGSNTYTAKLPVAAGFGVNNYTHLGIPATLFTNSPKVGGKQTTVNAGSFGVTLLKENPAIPTKGMVAYISNAYNSGWLPGDIRLATLADTVAETITASGELVTNGTLSSGAGVGYTDINAVTSSITTTTTEAIAASPNGGNILKLVSGGGLSGVNWSIPTVIGKTYLLTSSCYGVGYASAFLMIGTSIGGAQVLASYQAWNASQGAWDTKTVQFVATSTTTYIGMGPSQVAARVAYFDGITCRLADLDRSVKNTGLVINGALTKAAVASGAQLMAYSGFSASNYLEQPYNSQLDFGTGDFCVMGWAKSITVSNSTQSYINLVGTNGRGIQIGRCTSGGVTYPLTPYIKVIGAGGTVQSIGGNPMPVAVAGSWDFLTAICVSGVISLYINGQLAITLAAGQGNISTVDGKLQVGIGFTATSYEVAVSLWRISATAPSADQIAHIYRTELPLFQANAKCTIDGTSTAVTALAYGEVSDTLHVGTSWGRSSFKDLLRIESEVSTVGAITSLSVNQGSVLQGGATSGRYYQPAMLLRDELRRRDEARKALGKVPVFFEFDAVTSQVAFVLPKGYVTKAVYSSGTLKRMGSGKDYTLNTDGFAETVTFAVAPGNTIWVSIMCVRAG